MGRSGSKDLFNEIKFESPSHVMAWVNAFPGPAAPPTHHTKSLLVNCTAIVTTADVDRIQSFTNVTRLEVRVTECPLNKPGLDAFHNLSPVIESLRVRFCSGVPLSKLFALVYSFPSLSDLAIVGGEIDKDGEVFLPSTSPVFTGTLLLSCDLKYVMGQLLRLPDRSLDFREIVLEIDSHREKDAVQHAMRLMERCSNTLECIDIDFSSNRESRPFGSCVGSSG